MTSHGADRIYVFSIGRAKIVDKVGVGRGPNWVPFSPQGKYCCVSNVLSDDLSVINAADRREVARIKVGKQPKRLVVVDVPTR